MIAVRRADDHVTEHATRIDGFGRSGASPGSGALIEPTTASLGLRTRRSVVRRRRAMLSLASLGAAAILAVLDSGATGAWLALLAVAALGVTYGCLLHRARRIAAEREFARILGPGFSDFRTLGDIALRADADSDAVTIVPAEADAWRHGLAVAHFALASVAGWALAPFVFALTLLIGEQPKDSTGQRWLANLKSAQDQLRERSIRTLAVSAATTASVTAAGTVAVLGGAGVASAATVSASASLPAGVGLPAGASLAGGVGSSASYRVVAGDTLSAIAARFGTTVGALAASNGIADPNVIYAGQVLTVPGGSGASTAGASSYTVAQGDTLSGIAARFGTTVGALAAANHISNPNFIYPGEVISLGGGATLTATSSPAPVAAASAPSASGGARAVQVALAQVGKPYQWAGAGPGSFDCSGLVMYAWAQAGVSLPHYSVAQYQDTTRIGESQLEPGDLVFYDTGSGAQPNHVTIYIGGGKVVTADSPGTYIKVVPLNWDGTPMGFGRVR